jgi:hypothetical protein
MTGSLSKETQLTRKFKPPPQGITMLMCQGHIAVTVFSAHRGFNQVVSRPSFSSHQFLADMAAPVISFSQNFKRDILDPLVAAAFKNFTLRMRLGVFAVSAPCTAPSGCSLQFSERSQWFNSTAFAAQFLGLFDIVPIVAFLRAKFAISLFDTAWRGLEWKCFPTG